MLSNGRPEAQRPAEPQAPPRAKQKGTPRGSVGRLVATEVKEEKAGGGFWHGRSMGHQWSTGPAMHLK